jgi:rRNA maturation endonuclease Nob1
MSKLQEILNGWKNVIWEKSEIEKLAMNRAVICSSCDKNVDNVCQSCGCPLIAKTRSEYSKCPEGKW